MSPVASPSIPPAVDTVVQQPASTELLPPKRTDRVRVTGLLTPRLDITPEAFFKHWYEVHGPLFRSLDIVKKNLFSYEQYHCTSQFNDGIAAMGFKLVPFRGFAVFEAESYEKVLEIFASDEYARTVRPDEDNFMLRSETGFVAGELYTFFESNGVVGGAKE